jgi:hypothetical protein
MIRVVHRGSEIKGRLRYLHGPREGKAAVGGQAEGLAVGSAGPVQDLHVHPHPGVRRHRGEAPVQAFQHNQLRVQDFLLRARSVCRKKNLVSKKHLFVCTRRSESRALFGPKTTVKIRRLFNKFSLFPS